ncbi:MAG: cytochrome c-type biogenesis protein CcmH [Chloroflexota bacterium]|nr:cytochrome c-type biogenesis protein CcmH [Chloroflexota bacterium]MDE3102790.1 cytochrome c-type biogenesis protein CcmH [Chloroflexota bacterium]
MTARIAILIGLLAVAVAVAVAVAAVPRAESPADRVARLSSELRCPVCQGLSVEDSPSDTARQMRQLVAQRVQQGWTDDQIRAEFRAAYGDWIFLAPPLFDPRGAIWLVPLAVVVVGSAIVAVRMRRAAPPPAAPTEAQLALLRERALEEPAE